ncbi:MAG: D-alanine--D-alanine ligase [Actinobacteria bacterium BACL2 MAG-120820-bin50]|jgi:D-alanine-D-alanine ligase|uniref:D-alanine--D-alanine ligase n=2 Tax=ac1 cluster TaxID=1655545 RepID=A0A0R2QQ17_9ACTN|nr:MAG: D-alanine--D-alanine ligase [Actinobacteria bacterium BACL2 MAG-120813-bin23]KRO52366.1 MAG: D-alanine--D-alanine ligase [Actinobacteria bacterium BACL2 MAG-120820-bin50]MDP4615552.1 D-alanine--D-alanine ligase [Candidatus Nanopelagicales bacterium]MDP4864318.1 D-alanine--D-alanine ligase [Candidatus Nanopelagicaceae bacterium]MDP4750945.1 D-alanine--D-alanine ligase [Candidatus Nanopelagicales bacterium]
MNKIRVAIIAGGRSSEHPISCISASGVLAAIDRSKFEPILIGITQSGTWIDMRQSDFERGSDGLSYVPEGGEKLIVDIHGIKDSKGSDLGIEIAFPLLHGAYGEDGTIQGLFEMAGIAYVGSGVLASAVAMDKSFAKPIYADFGLKVADGITVHQDNWNKSKDLEIAKIRALGFPIFIKPARSGSSRGTSKVRDESEISAALDDAFNYDPRVLVEAAVVGREIECAVLQIDSVATASVLGEVRVHPPHEFYDFEAKYLDGSTTFDIPANLAGPIASAISQAAITAFEALGCEGLARVDFFLSEDNQIIINELNTMPGFTPTSVFPALWEKTGKSYSQIITILLDSALSRQRNVIR